jgi:hypothetical protein
MLGGLLLTMRRTTLLGALVCAGVLSNIVVLNFSYDVCVKLFSTHLLACAVFLVVPDLRRLANFFLLNRPAPPADLRPLFSRPWLNRAALVLRTVAVVSLAGLSLFASWWDRTSHGDRAPKPPLYGIWDVSEFETDGEARPPLVTDATRWRRVILPRAGVLSIQLMDDSRRRHVLELDADTRTLTLTRTEDPAWKAVLSYQEPEPGLLALEGTFDDRKVRAKLRRGDESRFLLLTRGFHWINEAPFNR